MKRTSVAKVPFRAWLVATCAALVLAGCSSAGSDNADVAMRQIEDVTGATVKVPVKPQRVVTLSEPTLDAALALGVTPIGTAAGRGQATVAAYLADQAGELPILGGIAQPNYEAIGKAKPDLILVDGTSINNNDDAIKALGRIAPTVYTGYAGASWRANFDIVADALNVADQGAKVTADYQAKVDKLSADLGDYDDKTFSIVRWQGGSASLILQELPPGEALQDLGLARPAKQDRRGRGHSEPVSLENLQDIDADYMFFGTLGGSSVNNPEAGGKADADAAQGALAEAASVPGFSELRAYRNSHVIPVDGSAWTSTGGPILMNRIVDDVAKALTK